MREEYNDVIENADFHFRFMRKKIDSMSTTELKDRFRSEIQSKKDEFTAIAIQANHAICSLEDLIRQGNDIIKALDVINALDVISDDAIALNGLIDEANDLLPVLDELVQVGNSVVDINLDD